MNGNLLEAILRYATSHRNATSPLFYALIIEVSFYCILCQGKAKNMRRKEKEDDEGEVGKEAVKSNITFSKMQRYVTLGVPRAAARLQENYENAGVPQTATRCQET
jgi:hypothetical protein